MRTRLAVLLVIAFASPACGQDLIGVSVTPHTLSPVMRWRRPPNPELAARVELFVLNSGTGPLPLNSEQALLFDDKTPQDLLADEEWAWHSTPQSWLQMDVELPPDRLTVLAFNGRTESWGVNTRHTMQIGDSGQATEFQLDEPSTWLSAVTFLTGEDISDADSVFPDRVVIHVTNHGEHELELQSLRLWLPEEGQSYHLFRKTHEIVQFECFPSSGLIPPSGKGCLVAETGALPLTYAVVELRTRSGEDERSLWAHLRIKREVFDISGGWVASDIGGRNSLTCEEYLRTLQRMHINTGQIEEVAGYTDNPDLYAQYPLKRFNRMQDLSRYDADEMLPQIHAVEFLGEPQYGGGRPVPPQEVWDELAPYQPSRLATSVTLSEERTWRYYAGLSDYPHYDAYRVIAPAADSWRSYDRWDGERIRWGAPLETIGEMTRSLRELSRPKPIAYWSQGAHAGWGGRFSPRRGSPTPEELRSQAWHGLAARITSLYWFNLSLKSLVKYPDLIDPITRVNREIRLIDDILLAGDAYGHEQIEDDGRPDWATSVVAAPQAALLVAHDVAYRPDPQENVFRFARRPASLEFPLPAWFDDDCEVFALDADGIHDLKHTIENRKVTIDDEIHVVGIYVVANDRSVRSRITTEHADLIRGEVEQSFDPAHNEEDLLRLKSLLKTDD